MAHYNGHVLSYMGAVWPHGKFTLKCEEEKGSIAKKTKVFSFGVVVHFFVPTSKVSLLYMHIHFVHCRTGKYE